MSTKHIRTAADLVRFGAGLKVDCTSCGNSRTLDGFDVARTLGTGELLKIQPRLKCTRCGPRRFRLVL
jgi:DNA-directed RNA polymerase subunit RPC12/RpoP